MEVNRFPHVSLLTDFEHSLVLVNQGLDAISIHRASMYQHPQFDQIVFFGEHDKEQARLLQHARAFRRISASVNRQDDVHAAILEGKATIGVAHDPCQRWKATGRESDRGPGQIDADGGNRLSCEQAAQHLASPGPQIDNHRVRWQIERKDPIDHGVNDSAADSGLLERRTRLD
jgi:hypothetical protein